MLEQIFYLQSACSAFAVEVNPHKIQHKTALEYAEKLFGKVDSSIIEEMVDEDLIIKARAFVGDKKITCYDFHLESAIESVYNAVKKLTC